jgi:hypothetical protein
MARLLRNRLNYECMSEFRLNPRYYYTKGTWIVLKHKAINAFSYTLLLVLNYTENKNILAISIKYFSQSKQVIWLEDKFTWYFLVAMTFCRSSNIAGLSINVQAEYYIAIPTQLQENKAYKSRIWSQH